MKPMTAEEFNKRYPVGHPVLKAAIITSKAFENNDGNLVVQVSGTANHVYAEGLVDAVPLFGNTDVKVAHGVLNLVVPRKPEFYREWRKTSDDLQNYELCCYRDCWRMIEAAKALGIEVWSLQEYELLEKPSIPAFHHVAFYGSVKDAKRFDKIANPAFNRSFSMHKDTVEEWARYIKPLHRKVVRGHVENFQNNGGEIIPPANIVPYKDKCFVKTEGKHLHGFIDERGNTYDMEGFPSYMSETLSGTLLFSQPVKIKEDQHGKREWRFFVGNGKILSSSRYLDHENSDEPTPAGAINCAKYFAYLMDNLSVPVFVVDIMEMEDGNFDLVEFNAARSAAIYEQNDPTKILKAVFGIES